MTSSAAGPAVIGPDDVGWVPVAGGQVTMRTAVGRDIGCRSLEQRIMRYQPGAVLDFRNPSSEDIGYVVEGRGSAVVGDRHVDLRPGTALLVPPDVPCRITSSTDEPLLLLSVLAPQPGTDLALPAAEAATEVSVAVQASEQPVIPAGSDEQRGLMDRYFRLLMDPSNGCRYVTQFVGFIERSRAPLHTHLYDEVVYVVDGHGIAHFETGDHPIGAGSSIYLPPGAPHCLENPAEQPLTLVGVFCPAGSPAARRPVSGAGGDA